MRIVTTAAAVLVLLLGVLAAPGAASDATRPDACKMLRAALKGTVLGLRVGHRAAGSYWANCEFDDGHEPGPDRHWSAHFNGLIPQPSVADAKRMWGQIWKGWKGTTGEGLSVARLRGYGADDAFGVESFGEDPRSSNTMVWWRKGRYFGILEITGLGAVADFETAEDMLRQLMRGVARG
jgi:hypothetical protein